MDGIILSMKYSHKHFACSGEGSNALKREKQNFAVKQTGTSICKPKQNVKLLPIISKHCWKVDVRYSRLHIHFAGSLNNSYYLVVVNGFSIWPEISKCKNPISPTVMNRLFEILARFDVIDKWVSDSGTDLVTREL